MRWLCFFFPHKWVDALDPDLLTCDRCPKLKRRPSPVAPPPPPPPPPVRTIPYGAYPCPYLSCDKWCPQPAYNGMTSNGHMTVILAFDAICPHCGGGIRWLRQRGYTWGRPVARDLKDNQEPAYIVLDEFGH